MAASTSFDPAHPTIERLEDQIRWYDRKSSRNQRIYKWLKGVTLVSGVLVPVLSYAPWGRLPAGALGVIIVIAEGIQQINQYQANWIAYRSTAEALKHEKYLFLASAGPYSSAQNPIAMLAERVEGQVSQENAKWITAQEHPARKSPQEQNA